MWNAYEFFAFNFVEYLCRLIVFVSLQKIIDSFSSFLLQNCEGIFKMVL